MEGKNVPFVRFCSTTGLKMTVKAILITQTVSFLVELFHEFHTFTFFKAKHAVNASFLF